jgi:hypothetical protein
LVIHRQPPFNISAISPREICESLEPETHAPAVSKPKKRFGSRSKALFNTDKTALTGSHKSTRKDWWGVGKWRLFVSGSLRIGSTTKERRTTKMDQKYSSPELVYVGTAKNVVLGSLAAGDDVRSEFLVCHLEFASDEPQTVGA